MNNWPREAEIRMLIERAMLETHDLTVEEEPEMIGSFDRLGQLLDTPANGPQQLLLLLSAGLLAMQRAERLVLQALRLDRWVSLSEEAVLVHLRLICAEIIGILMIGSDDLRLAPVPVRWR
jgi:ParB-like chromosome segregation protein Spo0J